MIAGLEHVGLMAKDPEQLAAWYEKVLDFRQIFKNEKDPLCIFIAGEGGGVIEIISYPEGMEIPLEKDKRSHLAISVKDFEQTANHLRSQGVEFPEAPLELFKGSKALFFQDPEGNWLHLVYRPEIPWKRKT